MSTLDKMRIGDTILSIHGHPYEVVRIDADSVRGTLLPGPGLRAGQAKTFKADRLFCVDHHQGLWQETIN